MVNGLQYKLSFWFLKKKSLSLQTQRHKMQHGIKIDFLIEKRKLTELG